MNRPMDATTLLGLADARNITGRLIRTTRSGRELREYVIDGGTYRIEAWPTEHTPAQYSLEVQP